MDDKLPPLSNLCQLISKYLNNTNRVIATSTLVAINTCKVFYQCGPLKVTCSSNASKWNNHNGSSVGKLAKPSTISKPICSTIVSKGNICNERILSQHVKPLTSE